MKFTAIAGFILGSLVFSQSPNITPITVPKTISLAQVMDTAETSTGTSIKIDADISTGPAIAATGSSITGSESTTIVEKKDDNEKDDDEADKENNRSDKQVKKEKLKKKTEKPKTEKRKTEKKTKKNTHTTYAQAGKTLTKRAGVFHGPNGKETYYNLPMHGVVKIMHNNGHRDKKYWVRKDGVKMLGDYVMVAASLDKYDRGDIVETSLGTGMVCDTGGFAHHNRNQFDIATNW